MCQCLWCMYHQAIDALLQSDQRREARQQAQETSLVRSPYSRQICCVSLLKNGQNLQPQIVQMVQPAFPRTKCSRHDTLDKTSVVQNYQMPIGGGTTATCCKGQILRTLEWVTLQPLQ